MPIQHRSNKRSAARAGGNDYGSDDGLVVDSNTSDDAPLAKRAKTTTEGRKESANSRQKRRSAKTEAVGNADIDDNGDMFWEISNSRRVTISEFKGKYLISIREYYEKDGKHLPGKKGISMTLDQYSKFLSVVPEVETALKAKGADVVRPVFKSISGGDDMDDDVEEQDDDRERMRARAKAANGDKEDGKGKDPKKNFEATSEEDE